jgi:hypothetical protein
MARRARTASAVNPSMRSCPVCASKRVQGTFKGRETIKNRRIDASECTCLECLSSWHEAYMVRAQEIKVSDIRPALQAGPKEKASATADPGRLCPVCRSDATSAGFNSSARGDEGRIDYATCGCTACGALWAEAYYRRTGRTEVSDIRASTLSGALEADRIAAQKSAQADFSRRSAFSQVKPKPQKPAKGEFSEFLEDPMRPHAISHSHNNDGGCPMCGSVHIGIKPHGNTAASCSCTDCGASWDHRYVVSEGKAYRSNIKPVS